MLVLVLTVPLDCAVALILRRRSSLEVADTAVRTECWLRLDCRVYSKSFQGMDSLQRVLSLEPLETGPNLQTVALVMEVGHGSAILLLWLDGFRSFQ